MAQARRHPLGPASPSASGQANPPAMATAMRSSGKALPVLALAALAAMALWASPVLPAFLPVQPQGRGLAAEPAAAAAAAAAAALPTAAQAVPGAGALDVPTEALEAGSSISLAGLTEILMCGIVMGVVPTTILGLLVAAWLQFKKGPTLGL
uniref:Uncharacterized protein n=1 Tax=Alexandrium monilatum TaxID=311494 RepID=A0A7S4VZT8_9DINO